MTEKEKEAIKILEAFEPDDLIECSIYRKALEIIKNVIEKQDTEINKLNNVIKKIEKIIDDEFAVEAVMAIGALIDDLKQVKSNS